MPFRFKRMEIPEVILVEPPVFDDHRGFFMEIYKRPDFVVNGISEIFIQDNCSHSTQGVLRGLHYQKSPKAQGKLVTTLKGEIFDVAVDIRKGSPTYGKWVGVVLSAKNHHMLYIPVGFAHGFCVLSDEAVILYKLTEDYTPDLDRGVIWNDPDIGIQWPLENPILSEKDAKLSLLREADNDFVYGVLR